MKKRLISSGNPTYSLPLWICGMRKGQIAGLRWSYIAEKKLWNIPQYLSHDRRKPRSQKTAWSDPENQWSSGSQGSQCKHTDFSPLVHCPGSPVSCTGTQAQLMFPGVFSRMSEPLPTIPGRLAESPAHHIFTGSTGTLPLTEGVGASRSCPPKEESWVKCCCLSLSR